MAINILSLFGDDLATVFVNHEHVKLHIDNSINLNVCLFLFIVLILVTLRKSVDDQPLSFLQTEQIKGLSMIMIVVAHYLYYCYDAAVLNPVLSFLRGLGHTGVAIFLMLSGFGLSISLQKKGIKNFFYKRIVRIYIPIVIAMIVEIFLNHVLLQPKNNIVIDFIKIFTSLISIDKNMWFIIFILFWYCLTYLVFRLDLSNKEKLIFLCSVSLILLTVPQISILWKFNAFSFPLGCWLGFNSELVVREIKILLQRNLAVLLGITLGTFLLATVVNRIKGKFFENGSIGAIILAATAIIYLTYLVKIKNKVNKPVETISLGLVILIVGFNYLSNDSFLTEITTSGNIIWCIFINIENVLLATIIILSLSLLVKYSIYSLFLRFVGQISFELYLLHGMFMYSFDFVLFRGNAAITFWIYFLAICIASLILQRLSQQSMEGLNKICGLKG